MTSKENKGRELFSKCSKKKPLIVNKDPELLNYFIRKKYTSTGKYGKGLEVKNSKLIRKGEELNEEIQIELQDFLLSRKGVTSRIPAITNERTPLDNVVDWAAWLDLLNRDSYYLTNKGRLCKALADSQFEFDSENNPFILNEREKIAWFFLFLEADGDTLFHFLPRLTELNYKQKDSGTELFYALEEVLKKYSKVANLGSVEHAKYVKLESVVKSMKDYVDGTRSTKGGIDHRAAQSIARTEPLKDIGILDAEDSFNFSFKTKKATEELGRIFGSWDSTVEDFIKKSFFTAWSKAFEIDVSPLPNKEIQKYLIEGYNQIKTGTGTAPIKEAGLLIGINALMDGKLVEIETIEDFLKAEGSKDPKKYRLRVDTYGRIKYFKLSNL